MKIKNHLLSIFCLKKYIFLAVLMMSSSGEAQTINISGTSWNVGVPSITEAGTNYSGTYDNPNQLILSGLLPGSILSLLATNGARISMHYTPTLWNSNLHLYAKRSGGTTKINGLCLLCTATINGGDVTFIEIPQSPAATLSTITFGGLLGIDNSVNYSAINVQLEIRGVSVTIPAATYSSQIIFTIGPN